MDNFSNNNSIDNQKIFVPATKDQEKDSGELLDVKLKSQELHFYDEKKAHHHHHHHHHHYEKETGWKYYYHHFRRWLHKQKKNKYYNLFLAGIYVLVLGMIFLGVRKLQGSGLLFSKPEKENISLREEYLDTSYDLTGLADNVIYDSRRYVLKKNVETYLFIGVDAPGTVRRGKAYEGGGQSDTLVLLVADKDANTWRMLPINRDTITTVRQLDIIGRTIGAEEMQIALSHVYGDGKASSCENTTWSVSKLLGGIHIDNYFALNVDGIQVLNDAFGGVELCLDADIELDGTKCKKGDMVLLMGQSAEDYVRHRKDTDDETNIARMARQSKYLETLFAAMSYADDATFISAYDEAYNYFITDLKSQELVNLAHFLSDATKLSNLEITGSSSIEDGFMAFHANGDSVDKALLDLFYNPAGTGKK